MQQSLNVNEIVFAVEIIIHALPETNPQSIHGFTHCYMLSVVFSVLSAAVCEGA